nr:hypothetical protein [Tanacetum cinerariifolium]
MLHPGLTSKICKEYYEDILPVIMDKVHHDKRKEVHARLDFGEGSRERRTREGSYYSSARTLSARPERLKVQDRLRYNNRHVFDRLGHRRQIAFDRISKTYLPSTTKSRPGMTSCRDRSRGRSRPYRLDASNGDCPENNECFSGVGEFYNNSHSSYGTGINHGYRYHDRDRSRHMKRGRDSESLLSSISKSDSSDGRHWKSKSKRYKCTDEDDLTMPWMCEEVDSFTPRIRNFKSSRVARVWFDELPSESIDSYKGIKAAFLAYFMQQKKYIKDPVEIRNIKQKDGETIKDFMERFKVETGHMKGALECMRIFRFIDGVNNPELTKRLNEHVPKTMEEMMITTTAFIRGEAAAASEKKGKFQPPPPMVTPLEKISKNNCCDFHNDKGHSTDECMQLKKQIEELIRAGKLSHLIKKIKHGRDQSKVGKKETPAKDKPTAIYMIQSWQRMTRQKVNHSFERVKEIMFPSLATSSGTEGPLFIEEKIYGHMIHRMYVDGGSSMEVLYEHCFNRLRPEVKNQMVPTSISLTGFSEVTIWPLGQLSLLVTIGYGDHSTRAWMNFMIVRSLSPYNGIIGRPRIKKFKRYHPQPTECVRNAIGGTLSAKRRTELCSILEENLDIFAWRPSDMAGVPRSVAEHWLNIREGYLPVRQKKRGQALERAKAIQAEIQLAESDEEKTSFHTGQGVYCYTKMPFGLKNVGATYQRLVDKAFNSQIGRNIEVYIDDLVIKSRTEVEMLTDIGETFRTLRKINMKLNPKNSLRIIKEVQSLNGKLASLNKFLSKSAKKSLPLFKTLKKCIKKSDFHYTSKAEQAFKQPKEELIVYLSASYGAISAILMTERAKRLMRYFQAHPIAVITDQPIKQIMSHPNVAKCQTKVRQTPIIEYFKEGTLPSDNKETRKLRIKARQYELLEGVLYRRSFLTLWLRCVGPLQVDYVIKEIHEGSCSMHVGPHFSGGQSHTAVILLANDARDARDMICTCNNYQIHHPVTRSPQQPLTPITAPKSKPELGEVIKARLGEGNNNSVKELLHVLWDHRIMIKSSHGDTSFSLTYGTKAVIPAEIGMPTYRIAAVYIVHNDEKLRLNLDLLEERCERAAIREAKAKSKMTKYYNARVHGVTFRPGDFVYRSNDASHIMDRGKLKPKWEGPYEVTKVLRDGAYKLRSMDRTVLPRTWKITNIKKCYL